MALPSVPRTDTGEILVRLRPGDRYRNVLSSEFIEARPDGLLIADALASFPVALLELLL